LQFHPVAEYEGNELGQCNECPHYHEKLTGMKLLWKLLETRVLEVFKKIIDQKK